jgi:hypothetical protein
LGAGAKFPNGEKATENSPSKEEKTQYNLALSLSLGKKTPKLEVEGSFDYLHP